MVYKVETWLNLLAVNLFIYIQLKLLFNSVLDKEG